MGDGKFEVGRPGYELLTENLRRLSEERRIPLTLIADRAGIDRRELFAVMAGEVDPDLDWLRRLAEGVGVRLSELFMDTERGLPN